MSHDDEGHGKEFHIIVNTQPKTVTTKTLTYQQVVAIAFPVEANDPTKIFNVEYEDAHKPKEGRLIAGQSVEIEEKGTIFDVTPDTQS